MEIFKEIFASWIFLNYFHGKSLDNMAPRCARVLDLLFIQDTAEVLSCQKYDKLCPGSFPSLFQKLSFCKISLWAGDKHTRRGEGSIPKRHTKSKLCRPIPIPYPKFDFVFLLGIELTPLLVCCRPDCWKVASHKDVLQKLNLWKSDGKFEPSCGQTTPIQNTSL